MDDLNMTRWESLVPSHHRHEEVSFIETHLPYHVGNSLVACAFVTSTLLHLSRNGPRNMRGEE